MEILGNLVEGLMQVDSDGRIIPAIAESCEVSGDGKTYTFHLRDAKWSNGANVTADDFVFLPGVKINLHPAMTAESIEIVSNCMNGAYSDYADYWAAMHEAEEIVMREAAIAPLYFQSDAVLIADGVQGVEFHAVGTPRVFKNAVMK